jgi:hypothetical protein
MQAFQVFAQRRRAQEIFVFKRDPSCVLTHADYTRAA